MNGDDLDHVENAQTTEIARRRDLERLIRWYFPQREASTALFVAWTVSGMQPLAFHRNGGEGIGLFDIDPADAGIAEGDAWRLHNPIVNVAAAHKLWAERGWAHWGVILPMNAAEVFATSKGA